MQFSLYCLRLPFCLLFANICILFDPSHSLFPICACNSICYMHLAILCLLFVPCHSISPNLHLLICLLFALWYSMFPFSACYSTCYVHVAIYSSFADCPILCLLICTYHFVCYLHLAILCLIFPPAIPLAMCTLLFIVCCLYHAILCFQICASYSVWYLHLAIHCLLFFPCHSFFFCSPCYGILCLLFASTILFGIGTLLFSAFYLRLHLYLLQVPCPSLFVISTFKPLFVLHFLPLV